MHNQPSPLATNNKCDDITYQNRSKYCDSLLLTGVFQRSATGLIIVVFLWWALSYLM